MCLYLKIISFILTLTISQLNGFRDENVFETFDTNDKNNEQTDENRPQFTTQSKQLYEMGKRQYEVMNNKRQFYGNCWRKAIELLETNCKQLNDETQSRLSIAFTNCFLEKSGLNTYPCEPSISIKECLKDMTDRAFNTYTEFFTHTQSVCFYLLSEFWQQNTESTIDKLTETSAKVSHRLEDAKHQLEILSDFQERSIGSQILLNNELIAARNAMNDFKSTTSEQRFIVREILDRFIKLQDFVLVEISYGYSLLFFMLSIIVIYFMTTPNRTSEARLWLFIVLIINLFIERLIASYSAEEQLDIGLKTVSIVINERIWLSRKITLGLMFAILLWFAITYKNYGFVNYNLLNQHTLHLTNIQNQLNQLYRNGQLTNQSQLKTAINVVDNEYSSNSDSDFTDDSDYSTDESDATEASIETRSTIPIVSSSSAKSCPYNEDNNQDSKIENHENKSLVPIPADPKKRVYDLRPRKSNTLSNNSYKEESVEEFASKVQLSENISRMTHQRMNSILMSTDAHMSQNIYSSDEN